MGTFKVKVTSTEYDVMFVAEIDDKYISPFAKHCRQYVTNTVKVKPGTGNTGDNLEYQATYSGVDIPYPQFVRLMNSISC